MKGWSLLEWSPLQDTLRLAYKYKTRVEVNGSDRRSSLLRHNNNYRPLRPLEQTPGQVFRQIYSKKYNKSRIERKY
jgi:hypothetical protein